MVSCVQRINNNHNNQGKKPSKGHTISNNLDTFSDLSQSGVCSVEEQEYQIEKHHSGLDCEGLEQNFST